MGEMGVTEGAMGNFQPVAGPSSIASAEETPKPIGGEVQSPVNGDGAVVSDGVVKKKRKRRTKAELAEYDRRTEELAALYGNDGESEEVRYDDTCMLSCMYRFDPFFCVGENYSALTHMRHGCVRESAGAWIQMALL